MNIVSTPEKHQLILAALLHDIGKFWQRADDWLAGQSAIKNRDPDHLKSLVPHSATGRPMYQHAVWTYQFLEDHADRFNELGLWETKLGKLSELSARHHAPKTEAERLLQLADHWSSAIDRREKNEEEEKIVQGKYAYRTTLLLSPFGRLNLRGSQNISSPVCTPIVPLSIGAHTVFPGACDRDPDDYNGSREVYQKLWHGFVKEFKQIPTEDSKDFLFTLQQLLAKYCWCIPSDTQKAPIVNLYEHLKTTAALVSCLYDHSLEAKVDAETLRHSSGNLAATMVCLDLSGIQSFIYDIASKKAFKSLKGRSYFLTALMDQMVHTVLKETGQSFSSMLYSAGGKAYFLLPNTTVVREGLERAMEKLEDQSYYGEGGGIFPAVGKVTFHFNLSNKRVISPDLPDGHGDLGRLWKTVSDRASAKKNRRYERILTDQFDDFFSAESPSAILAGQTDQRCAVTGVPLKRGEGKLLNEQDRDGPVVTTRVYDHIKMGRLLKNASFALLADSATHDLKFNQLGRTLSLRQEGEARSGQIRLRFNNTDFIPESPIEGAYGFTFYGGNSQPTPRSPERDVAEFEDLCNNGLSKSGEPKIEKLGVLRMDVDDLGKMFISGIPEADKSFAAYATLSAQLNLFFSGYLNTIREEDEFQNTLSIVYSGGDDLFAIGRWDRTLAFAERVREDFKRFVGREDLTISGGLTIVDHKFPVYRAAAMAGEDEKTAKSHRCRGQAKNSITLFGKALNWTHEYPVVKTLKESLHAHLSDGLSRAVLHIIQEAYVASLPDPKTGKVDLSYKWQTAYKLKRMADRYGKKKPEIAAFINELNKDLLHNDDFGADQYLRLAAVASRWAEYELKLKPDEEA
jgi:CRISPR-associated protein Csm1